MRINVFLRIVSVFITHSTQHNEDLLMQMKNKELKHVVNKFR